MSLKKSGVREGSISLNYPTSDMKSVLLTTVNKIFKHFIDFKRPLISTILVVILVNAKINS